MFHKLHVYVVYVYRTTHIDGISVAYLPALSTFIGNMRRSLLPVGFRIYTEWALISLTDDEQNNEQVGRS